MHAWGHDTDDGSALIDDADVPADNVLVGAVALPPQSVADQDDDRRPRRVLGGREVASESRGDAEHLEEVRGDVRAWDLVRCEALIPHVEGAVEQEGHS